MRKIPTLFKREFKDHKVVLIMNDVTPGLEWVLKGEGEATLKIDGSCCAVINGEYYKRYDAKAGKTPPAGAIPCQDAPDPVTGHWPHWVKLDKNNPADKWFFSAMGNENLLDSICHMEQLPDGTYEAVGPHFNGNPYHFIVDSIVRHGSVKMPPNFPRDFDGIYEYLRTHEIEGVVFWKGGVPRCKIKRTDFGLEWPIKKEAPNA